MQDNPRGSPFGTRAAFAGDMLIGKNSCIVFSALVAIAGSACIAPPESSRDAASAAGAEDAASDDKAPLGFGIEPDAPDGLAVLQIASTYSVAKLVAAGLTKRVAKKIYDTRKANGPYVSLVALDQVPNVGIKVFSALRWHATISKLYPTSLRIPAVSADGEALPLLVNTALSAAGLPPIAAHVWVNQGQMYGGILADWANRFDEAGLGEEIEPLANATISDFAASAEETSAPTPCWIGNPWQVPALVWAEADSMMSDQYGIWGWRVGDKVELEDDFDIDSLDDAAPWLDYDTDSNAVLIIQSTYGDSFSYDVVPACRNPR